MRYINLHYLLTCLLTYLLAYLLTYLPTWLICVENIGLVLHLGFVMWHKDANFCSTLELNNCTFSVNLEYEKTILGYEDDIRHARYKCSDALTADYFNRGVVCYATGTCWRSHIPATQRSSHMTRSRKNSRPLNLAGLLFAINNQVKLMTCKPGRSVVCC